MFYPQVLDSVQKNLCHNTISSNTLYMLVGNALVCKDALSVVRMADGEKILHDYCRGKGELLPIMDEKWKKQYGIEGIENEELLRRLDIAAKDCTYFAPSVSGIQRPDFNLYNIFPGRKHYADNFFADAWSETMKIQLFNVAHHVLFIHYNTCTADAMQIRAKWGLNVKVTYLKLTNWRETEDVIERAKSIDAPLVLFSAGPAGKYIGPKIATTGNIPKVTLDIGHAADHWTLLSLKDVKRLG